jgi:hypothetical protein
MTNTEFHVSKENTIKKLNLVVQTVLVNEFHEDTKKKIAELGITLAKNVNNQRRGVYELLDNFDDFKESYDPAAPKYASQGAPMDTDVRVLHNAILQNLSEIIAESKATPYDVINPMNNKKLPMEVKEGFDAVTKEIVSIAEEMIAVIQESDKIEVEETTPPVDPPAETKIIKHKLTEEDFDNNPELNNRGLNVGDEIDIDEKLLFDEEYFARENLGTDKTPAPPVDPPAVTPIEEIQKQNDKEKKGSRKDKKK